MKRTLNDLQLNEKVSFKDPSYGAGYIMGYNKEIGKHLVGYNAQCKRHSQSFPNSTGQFVQNKDNKYVYSDRTRDYTHFFFADSVLELLNTENSADGNYHTGDVVEVQFNANGQAVLQGHNWDGSTTRKGTIVGMDDYGVPLLYMDVPKTGQAEYGQAYNPDFHRWIDRRYDGTLNTNRYAFVRGVAMSKSSSKEKPQVRETVKEHTMSNQDGVAQKSFMEIMKGDAKVAGVRIAAEQMSSGLKKALITLMEKKGQSSERVNALKEMLDTTFGKALISYLAGTALTYASVISEDPRAKMLAAEFRVSGISTAGNELIDVAMEHFLPVLQNALTSLPAAESEVKARVGTSTSTPVPSVEELEQAEKKTEKTLTV